MFDECKTRKGSKTGNTQCVLGESQIDAHGKTEPDRRLAVYNETNTGIYREVGRANPAPR